MASSLLWWRFVGMTPREFGAPTTYSNFKPSDACR
jgi:hypothetical protein